MEKNRELRFEVNETVPRLDQFVTERTEKTRSQVKFLIEQGLISVNGSRVKAGQTLRCGDVVDVTIPLPTSSEIVPQDIALDIVFEDQYLVVINKSSDMVVHPAAGNWDGTLVNALLFHCQDLSGIGGKLRPGIVHRLDKDTTGLMVVAKDDSTHQDLAAQIGERQVKRHYLALCHGRLKESQGTIEAPIGRHPRHRQKMAIVARGRTAVTRFVVKQSLARHTLVECQLETGRTHQIRVHLASIHHPLVGDPAYGIPRNNLGATRQMLHACYLGLVHPHRGPMEFRSEPPQDFLACVKRAQQTS